MMQDGALHKNLAHTQRRVRRHDGHILVHNAFAWYTTAYVCPFQVYGSVRIHTTSFDVRCSGTKTIDEKIVN